MARFSIIVAMAENGVIGRDGTLPWSLPEDLRHFRALTLDKPIIMGRKTFQSIGRALDRRRNIVVSRDPDLDIPGAEIFDDPIAAARVAAASVDTEDGPGEVAVIGGAQIYRALLPHVSVIHLTRVRDRVEGDTLFPALDPAEWRDEPIRQVDPAPGRPAYDFHTLTRIGPPAPVPDNGR